MFALLFLTTLAGLAEAGDLGYATVPAVSYASYAPAVKTVSYATAPVAYAPAVKTLSYATAPVAYAPAVKTLSYAAAPLAYAHSAPVVAAPAVAKVAEPYDPNPSYAFSYGVSDPTTGDAKQQKEELSNGVVQGVYSLVEPDGTTRTVHYTADPHNGFNAVVDRQPAKVAIAAPVAKVAVSPYSVYH